jgi:hypothetical protein
MWGKISFWKQSLWPEETKFSNFIAEPSFFFKAVTFYCLIVLHYYANKSVWLRNWDFTKSKPRATSSPKTKSLKYSSLCNCYITNKDFILPLSYSFTKIFPIMLCVFVYVCVVCACVCTFVCLCVHVSVCVCVHVCTSPFCCCFLTSAPYLSFVFQGGKRRNQRFFFQLPFSSSVVFLLGDSIVGHIERKCIGIEMALVTVWFFLGLLRSNKLLRDS